MPSKLLDLSGWCVVFTASTCTRLALQSTPSSCVPADVFKVKVEPQNPKLASADKCSMLMHGTMAFMQIRHSVSDSQAGLLLFAHFHSSLSPELAS